MLVHNTKEVIVMILLRQYWEALDEIVQQRLYTSKPNGKGKVRSTGKAGTAPEKGFGA